MNDVSHYFASDLAWSATGDLLAASDAEYGKQRVLRRLLTNPAGYLWHPDYGAGLPSQVGRTLDRPAVEGLIRSQMALEASVSQEPGPAVALSEIPGGISARIEYADAPSGRPVLLDFSVAP